MTSIKESPKASAAEVDAEADAKSKTLQEEAIQRANDRAENAGRAAMSREEIRAARQPILDRYVEDNFDENGLPVATNPKPVGESDLERARIRGRIDENGDPVTRSETVQQNHEDMINGKAAEANEQVGSGVPADLPEDNTQLRDDNVGKTSNDSLPQGQEGLDINKEAGVTPDDDGSGPNVDPTVEGDPDHSSTPSNPVADEDKPADVNDAELSDADKLDAIRNEYKTIFGKPANAKWSETQIRARIDEAKE